MPNSNPIEVTFRSRGRARRQWAATFDLGDDIENRREACRHAWNMNAEIVSSASPSPAA